MRSARGPVFGSVLLILIFTVLSLSYAALISYLDAGSQKAFAERLGSSVKSYYTADGKAVEISEAIKSAVLSGQIPEDIDGVAIVSEAEGTFSFFCPVDADSAIFVTLEMEDNTLLVSSWRRMPTQVWTADDGLTVWQGVPES